MSKTKREQAAQRWTIFRRAGKWDDVIQGPNTGVNVDGTGDGTEVVRAEDYDALRDALVAIETDTDDDHLRNYIRTVLDA